MQPTVQSLPRRWSESDARAVLDALDASGLTLAEFARRTGIDRQRVRRWRAALRRTPGGPVQFVELVPAPAAAPEAKVEVVSPGGWRLLVSQGTAMEIVRVLVGAGC